MVLGNRRALCRDRRATLRLPNRIMRTTTFFTRSSPLMKATGCKPAITVTVSGRGCRRIGDLTETDIGFGAIAAGTGIQTSVLRGPPITTADGLILRSLDGAGSR